MSEPMPLPRSAPEEQGVPSAAILGLVDRWEREGLEPHSLVLVRHGHVVADGWWAPYHRDGTQLVYSISKSLTSSAVGLAVDEGLLRLEDRLVDLLPESAHAAGPRAARITLDHALRMATGHQDDTLDAMFGAEDPVAAFLAQEPASEPGTRFLYNNGATFAAAAAVQRAAGVGLVDYLAPRLLDPLGIPRPGWTSLADGRELGFSGAHLATGTIARLGLLLLQDGRWDGAQVLPDGWVARATSRLTDNSEHDGGIDWRVGYGYQFWRCRHDAYRGDGAFGQFCLVLPDRDTVLASTACTEDMQSVLDAVWEELLPALADDALPADPTGHHELRARLGEASLPAPSSAAAPTGTGPWHFAHGPDEDHPELRSVEVRRDGAGWTVVVTDPVAVEVPCGDGGWPSVTEDRPFVASGGWVAPDVFEARVVAVETPHSLWLRCEGDRVTARWTGRPLHRPALAALTDPLRGPVSER